MNRFKFNSSFSIVLNSDDCIIYDNQKIIFDLLNSEKKPNQHGWYNIEDTNYALWLPKMPELAKNWNNFLDYDANTIVEKPIKGKRKNDENTKKFLRIVFCGYSDGYRFLGVYKEKVKKGRKVIITRVSKTLIINKKEAGD